MLEADLTGETHSIGRFGWRWRKYPATDIIKEIEAEEGRVGRNWPPYTVGWFQGSRERFMAAKQTVGEVVAKLGWH